LVIVQLLNMNFDGIRFLKNPMDHDLAPEQEIIE
jgi:hypothetical protein